MSSTEESNNSDNSSEETSVFNLVAVVVALARYRAAVAKTAPMVNLARYAPFFDGCIGALDGTHVKVTVNKQSRTDCINRKGDATINVCAIIDMDGRLTFVGAGMAESVHDMMVLRDCWEEPSFPHPPHG